MRAVDFLYPGWKKFFHHLGVPQLPQRFGGCGLFVGDPRLRSFPISVRLSAKISVFGKSLKTDNDAFSNLWQPSNEDPVISRKTKKEVDKRMKQIMFCRGNKSCSSQGLEDIGSRDEIRKCLTMKINLRNQIALRRVGLSVQKCLTLGKLA